MRNIGVLDWQIRFRLLSDRVIDFMRSKLVHLYLLSTWIIGLMVIRHNVPLLYDTLQTIVHTIEPLAKQPNIESLFPFFVAGAWLLSPIWVPLYIAAQVVQTVGNLILHG